MSSPDSNGSPTSQRRTRLLVLAAVVLTVGIAYSAYWLVHGRYYESTDDAYVASDLVQITSEVPGAVVAVHVDDTQQVERGQLLVELDRSDAEVAMAQAEAELASTVREVVVCSLKRAGCEHSCASATFCSPRPARISHGASRLHRTERSPRKTSNMRRTRSPSLKLRCT
ncbi:MAG: biotin/lipoyl-binding protein [Steroidobacteraceae bacterium]